MVGVTDVVILSKRDFLLCKARATNLHVRGFTYKKYNLDSVVIMKKVSLLLVPLSEFVIEILYFLYYHDRSQSCLQCQNKKKKTEKINLQTETFYKYIRGPLFQRV